MGKFDLTLKERLFLVNQYRILEKLYPDEAENLSRKRDVVSSGYSLDYNWLANDIEKDELSEEECKEMLDILSMHRALKSSCESAGVDPKLVAFKGFDGNTETKQFAYTVYLLERCNSWDDLHNKGHDYNNHFPTLRRYRAMLRE